MWKSLMAALILAVLAGRIALADEPLVLRTGEVLLGDVTKVEPDTLEFQARFPVEKLMRIKREEVSDASLWRVLSSRIEDDDAAGRMTLGEWAEGRGLWAEALVEFRRAGEAASLKEQAAVSIARVEEQLAKQLFDRGEELFLRGELVRARHHFRLLVERYPSAQPAELAAARIKEVDLALAAGKNATEGARSVVQRTLTSWTAAVERATKLAKRAAKFEQDAIHGSTASKQIKSLKLAIKSLEGSWEEIAALGEPPAEVETRASAYAQALTASVKERLVQAYLDIGTAYLLRRSLGQADDYCAKACRLAPEDKGSHELHRHLIDSRLTGEWGAISHRRVGGAGR